MENLESHVRKGIAYLDAYGPKSWRNRLAKAIKAKRLDLGSPEHCVLGEVYGDFIGGRDALQLSGDQLAEAGFDRSSTDKGDIYRDLTATWTIFYHEGQRLATKSRKRPRKEPR